MAKRKNPHTEPLADRPQDTPTQLANPEYQRVKARKTMAVARALIEEAEARLTLADALDAAAAEST